MRPAPEDYTWVLDTVGLQDVILNTKDDPADTRIKLGDSIITVHEARAMFAGCAPEQMTRAPEDWTMVEEINGIESVVRSTLEYPDTTLLILDDTVLTVRTLRATSARVQHERRHGPKR